MKYKTARDELMIRPYEDWKLSRLGRCGIEAVAIRAYKRCIRASIRTRLDNHIIHYPPL